MRNCVWAVRANARSSSPAMWGNSLARAARHGMKRRDGTLTADEAGHDSHASRHAHQSTQRTPRGVFSSSAASFRWEREVVVLRGDDRAELRRLRCERLADFLRAHPAVELKDLAFTLKHGARPGRQPVGGGGRIGRRFAVALRAAAGPGPPFACPADQGFSRKFWSASFQQRHVPAKAINCSRSRCT